jgi:hypothetical protein
MKAYSIPGGASVKHRSLFNSPHMAADGQIPKVETGKTRTRDAMDGEHPSAADYPNPGEKAISLPSHEPHAGKSPSEVHRGHPNQDERAHPHMPQFALGGSPVSSAHHRHEGALGRAKVMLADHAHGHGATGPGGHPEGKAGNRAWNAETLRVRSTAGDGGSGFAFHHSVSLPEPHKAHVGRPAGAAGHRFPNPPEATPDTRSPGGKNFAFGGGAMGGRGRDRTA